MLPSDLDIKFSELGGQAESVRLYQSELLGGTKPGSSELWVNGLPLQMRAHHDPNDPTRMLKHFKGERFVDHFTGWGLVLARTFGERNGLKHRCLGITTLVRRELCDQTLPVPGPGGPVTEAPLYVDHLSVLNWNWQLWGNDTRMIFPSSHSNGPTDEFGHCGYEEDTPENVKKFLQNVWRRIYPGCLVVHGGLFYNAKTGHWIATTCRQATVGYILNIKDAGRGVGYDFTLHAPLKLGDVVPLPEIKIYYGPDRASMMSWLGDYVTHYYQEPPAWVRKTVFGGGLAWNNQPTWREQADHWMKGVEEEQYSGIGYSLVTNRPIRSGTTPLGYEPDPNHGTIEEFRQMCRRLADRGVPILIWMSHSGLAYMGSPDYDDDWFIRGIDGRISAAWGSIDEPGIAHINPGHPGYIEYTKKWIRFYIKECGCRGIFFDCLSWAFPPDFKPRSFMRYPGDTNRMALRFQREVYAYIKECDPEAIMLGEGASLEAPIDVFSIHANPKRTPGAMGPRDFFLHLNGFSPKRITIDQGPRHFPASGFCTSATPGTDKEHNRFMTRLLRQSGESDRFTWLPGDLSMRGNLLFVPAADDGGAWIAEFSLPPRMDRGSVLVSELNGAVISPSDGKFKSVPPGVYRMANPNQ